MSEIWADVDAALSEVPVNIVALIDDTDFKTREESVVYNQAGLDLVWNFVTTAGAYTQTAVTPTTAGNYDWTNQGNGMYSIEMPASGGASINNDTEGFGWFTGFATGILPWRGPIMGFRAAGINNKMIDDAYSATRGLAGTALPDAVADAAGGLAISDAGGLDMDAHVISARRGGYERGAVWIDTSLANTNTVSYVDGTVDNPVSTIAAATTIAVALDIKRFHLAPGSSITLAQSYDDYIFEACHATIALGGQSINNAVFYGATITGNDDGSNANHVQYFDCVIGTNTLGQFVLTRCYFTATLTLAEAGTYYMHQCFSGVAGTGTPNLDFGSALNASNVNMRDYSGGIEIENMGAGTGSYNLSLEGNGQLIINASCSATSTVAIRGNFTVTDNAGGAVTLSDDARYDTVQINGEVNAALVALGLDHLVAAAVAGVDITDDSIIAALVSANATADWDDFVNTTDSLQAIRDRGDAAWTTGAGGSDRLLMVDTTIATLASQISFTLTAGSADNDAYNNCTIVIEDVSTSTQKAVGLISAYVGATKTVTLKYDPGIFTMAATDKVYILAENALKSTDQNRQLDVSANGNAGIDWANVENPATALDLAGTDIQLVDTTTVNTDMRGTDGAAVAGEPLTAQEVEDTVWDAPLTGASHNGATTAGRRLRTIQEAQGYEGGAIWIDTINGTAGTTDFENGTVEKPVNTLADALTLSASLGFNIFDLAPGSSITFVSAQNNRIFRGQGWTLALGGQDIAGTTIIGATVSGIAAGTGTKQRFLHCDMNAITHIKNTHIEECGIIGAQTVGEAGDYFFARSHSAIAGTTTWIFDFGGAIGSTNLNIRNYSGGVQLENMGDVGTDTASIEGRGQIIEGTCTGGTVAVRGAFTTSGITNLTLSDDARFDVTQVEDAVWLRVIENSKTAEQILRIIKAAIAGKTNGGGTTTVNFRDDADTKNRIQATLDANGNRTALTLDGS